MVLNFSRAFPFLLLMLVVISPAAESRSGFLFNRFSDSDLILNGAAEVEPSGLLRLTSATNQLDVAHAFFPTPFPFINSSSGEPASFSTSFIFAIVPHYRAISSEGLAFAISPSFNLSSALPSQFLGLFNLTNDGEATNHIAAVEFDTIQNKELNDINDNHVGIDVNGLDSIAAAPASFASGSSSFRNLSLISGQPLRVWADYESKSMRFNVTVAPLDVPKPSSPLLSALVNLSSVFLEEMYVGFSSSTGPAAGSHYILGWSFCLNGREAELVISDLPSLPLVKEAKQRFRNSCVWVILGVVLPFVLTAICGFFLLLKTRKKFAEVVEEWEAEYLSQRLSYRDLHKATRGFSDENLLGNGGFGEVYRGLLSKSKQEIAVKRISHDSGQGAKEFLAEIAGIGLIRHRNLVRLLGYSRHRGKFMLVYDFMPNGSLDKYLFCEETEESLTWKQRFNIIKGIAAGLVYLHEELEQVVLHRDIKASNVLLDAGFNGKLGDFGLARRHDRGSLGRTTGVVGTLGYLAPELSRTGKSSTSSDVFAFGAFLLEVTCGKRPVEMKTAGEESVLVDWVLELMERGQMMEAMDRRLRSDFEKKEVELVLRLGLMCLLPAAAARPSMRQVAQYLEGEASLPAPSVDIQVESFENRLTNSASLCSSTSPGDNLPAMPLSGEMKIVSTNSMPILENHF